MRVVSNTSPILNLAIVGRLDVLRQQFGTVSIPREVHEELRVDEQLPGCEEIRKALAAGWITVVEVTNVGMRDALRAELDGGEAEAIVLASELQAERVLLDEREARRVAIQLGLRVTGVVGVLAKAYGRNRTEELLFVLRELEDRAGFRLSKDIMDAILRSGP
jgi:predicted nucleic acid-binding protein